jgi:excisionase family DNA binding protein
MREREFVDLKAASDFLNLRPRTVQKMVHDGILPGYKIGTGRTRRKLVFKTVELRAYVENSRARVPGEIKTPATRSQLRSDGLPFRHV